MKFMIMAFVGAAASFANAAVTPKPLDVWVPKIIAPSANTVWHHGEDQAVTWDTSDAPTSISNGFSIRLRYDGLISPVILAKDFDPRSGSVKVTVPWLVNGTYSIVLFGDSGNDSEDFTILE